MGDYTHEVCYEVCYEVCCGPCGTKASTRRRCGVMVENLVVLDSSFGLYDSELRRESGVKEGERS